MKMEPHREEIPIALPVILPLQSSGSRQGSSVPDRSGNCFANLDPELSVTAATDDFFQQFGRRSAEVCGRSLYDLLHPGTQAVLDRHFARLADGVRSRFQERVLGTKGGDGTFSVELIGTAVRDEYDRLAAIIVLVRPDPTDSQQTPQPRPNRPGRRKSRLTTLDARILEGVAAGASTVQLAARLYLSRQGIEYHVASMLRKLRVSNRAALVSRAYSMGLLAANSWPPRVISDIIEHNSQYG
ncbi:MAG TPA: LuxR C-terminal-related transcriptional regulator [Pseudonocardiaceae bacterium]|jgi:DNA-binding CsgD family transcriptional regulator|nr:LuxR C-terminal-related transcriptional regulator [Pseudonocardiaceae bacterium]